MALRILRGTFLNLAQFKIDEQSFSGVIFEVMLFCSKGIPFVCKNIHSECVYVYSSLTQVRCSKIRDIDVENFQDVK